MNIDWLEAWPQVGDAPDYLWQGEDCALKGECFNQLRPIISMLWFSLPHRLGLPSTAILALHALLLMASIALSVKTIISLTGGSPHSPRLQQALLAAASFCIHAIFLWPTFFHSLTDTPAALLTLCGLFLLARLQHSESRCRGFCYFAIGIMMGFAEGLRIFYLYPLLIFLLLYVVTSLLPKRKRDFQKLFLLSALLPVLAQNLATYTHSGEKSHLPSSSQMAFWSNMHSNNTYSGYDTLNPERGYPWFKSACPVTQGISVSWQKKDWQQLYCLMSGRMYFLLGSYSRHTYYEVIDIPLENGVMSDMLVFIDPARWNNPHSGGGNIFQVISESGHNHWQMSGDATFKQEAITIGLTSQSNDITSSLVMQIKSTDGHIVATKLIPMTKTPVRHFLHANIPQAVKYVVSIGTDKDHQGPAIFQMDDLKITPTEEEEEFPVASNKIRTWSPALLTVHIAVVLILFCATLYAARKNNCWIAITAFPSLILFQALVVIPEQRFIILTQIFMWSFILCVANIFFMRIMNHERNTVAGV